MADKACEEVSDTDVKEDDEIIDSFEEELNEAHESATSPSLSKDVTTNVGHKCCGSLLDHVFMTRRTERGRSMQN